MRRFCTINSVKMQDLASKFRGSLLGVIVGDTCGDPFENESSSELVQAPIVRRLLDKLEGPYVKTPYRHYTDDTAMTRVLAATLLETHKSKEPLQKQVALNFAAEYFTDPSVHARNYGGHVKTVFLKIRKYRETLTDFTAPAREQFEGSGSFGNGGAMRVAPVALWCWNDKQKLIAMAKEVTEVTHTHTLGVHGAILEALAIQQALHLSPEEPLDALKFLENLQETMSTVEIDAPDSRFEKKTGKTYGIQLNEIKTLLSNPNPSQEEVINRLGHSIAALYSVPTAIYSFLRSKSFRETIEYSICLGGDTDTIAAMAGAIAGAFYGDGCISKNMLMNFEKPQELIDYANQIYEVVGTKS